MRPSFTSPSNGVSSHEVRVGGRSPTRRLSPLVSQVPTGWNWCSRSTDPRIQLSSDASGFSARLPRHRWLADLAAVHATAAGCLSLHGLVSRRRNYPAVSEACNAPNESFVVTAGPDPLPLMANDDAYTVPKGQGTLLQPDVTDNDGGDFTGVEVVTEPSHGTLTRTDELAHDFTYIPETDFVGTDSFQYRLLGANAGLAAAAATIAADSCDVAAVTITVVDGVAAPFATAAADKGCGGGGGAEDVVDVGADCSGNVTFTNLLDEQVNVRYGPSVSLEGEFDLAAGQSETITTRLRYSTSLLRTPRPARVDPSRSRIARTAAVTMTTVTKMMTATTTRQASPRTPARHRLAFRSYQSAGSVASHRRW